MRLGKGSYSQLTCLASWHIHCTRVFFLAYLHWRSQTTSIYSNFLLRLSSVSPIVWSYTFLSSSSTMIYLRFLLLNEVSNHLTQILAKCSFLVTHLYLSHFSTKTLSVCCKISLSLLSFYSSHRDTSNKPTFLTVWTGFMVCSLSSRFSSIFIVNLDQSEFDNIGDT